MLRSRLLRAAWFAGVLANTVAPQACVPRSAAEVIGNSGFESEDDEWIGHNAPVATVPTYPSHSGSHMLVMSASYTKSTWTAAINIDSYTSQNVGLSRTGIQYQVQAFYNVIQYSKGETCLDSKLPLASCKLIISYVNQVLGSIHLSLTSGYVEFSTPFMPESSGRYLQFELTCKPPTETPQCGDIVVLLDDVTYTDAGHVCWTPLGCHTDSTSNRALPYHGYLPNWPYTTTIERCQEACGVGGYSYAGLEYGTECWCGNELVNTTPASSGCDMPCSNNAQQICGGSDRLSVFQSP